MSNEYIDINEKDKKTPKKSAFKWLDKNLALEGVFQKGIPVKYLPFVVYLLITGLTYIGLSYWNKSLENSIATMSKKMEGYKAYYNTVKSDYMYDSKQSVVKIKCESLGLKESKVPPKILSLKGEN